MAAWQEEWQAEALPPFINVSHITQHLFKKKYPLPFVGLPYFFNNPTIQAAHF